MDSLESLLTLGRNTLNDPFRTTRSPGSSSITTSPIRACAFFSIDDTKYRLSNSLSSSLGGLISITTLFPPFSSRFANTHSINLIIAASSSRILKADNSRMPSSISMSWSFFMWLRMVLIFNTLLPVLWSSDSRNLDARTCVSPLQNTLVTSCMRRRPETKSWPWVASIPNSCSWFAILMESMGQIQNYKRNSQIIIAQINYQCNRQYIMPPFSHITHKNDLLHKRAKHIQIPHFFADHFYLCLTKLQIGVAYYERLLIYLMSFFTKLFGGDDKKAKAPPPPPVQSEADKIAEKKIKIQAAQNDLQAKIKVFEEKQKKFENKIDLLKNKAKELMAADKKKEAKKYVEEATKVQKQAQSYTLRKKVLVDKKFQLDQAIMDMETINALDTVTDHLKEQEKYSEKLQDIILDGEEAKIRQKEIDDKMRDMVGDNSDEEDVDEMFNELMGEVNKDKKKQVEANKGVNVNVAATTAKNVQKKQQNDEIEDMLANL